MEYGGVQQLHVPSDHIWRPDIVLYNKYVYCFPNKFKVISIISFFRRILEIILKRLFNTSLENILFHCENRKRICKACKWPALLCKTNYELSMLLDSWKGASLQLEFDDKSNWIYIPKPWTTVSVFTCLQIHKVKLVLCSFSPGNFWKKKSIMNYVFQFKVNVDTNPITKMKLGIVVYCKVSKF